MDVSPAPGPDGTAQAPTCFRHPGRQTNLSCTRCGRPACPECLRPAPVGQHCLECIREGRRDTRAATGPFGGRVAASPVVTRVLIGLNVAFWIAEWVSPRVVTGLDMANWTVAHGQQYRLISSAFLHEVGLSGFGITHILFNMWALWAVGTALERELGHLRFAVLYLFSAVGGAVLFYLAAPVGASALGASGAVFGLFGAYFVMARRLRLDPRLIVILIVLNLVLTFTVRQIAWQAHVGGLITGALLAAAYMYAPRQQRALVQIGATVVVAALLAAAVLVRDSQLAVLALG